MYSWSILLWHRSYYPHWSRDSMSPVCRIFILSTGLPLRQLSEKIAARWPCKLPIKNLTPHYNSQFCVSFNFCMSMLDLFCSLGRHIKIVKWRWCCIKCSDSNNEITYLGYIWILPLWTPSSVPCQVLALEHRHWDHQGRCKSKRNLLLLGQVVPHTGFLNIISFISNI